MTVTIFLSQLLIPNGHFKLHFFNKNIIAILKGEGSGKDKGKIHSELMMNEWAGW
jgi:hypothetical protein